MIKVEQDLLVLDSSFTKDDVLAINEFVGITKRQEQERIVKLLQDRIDNHMKVGLPDDGYCACPIYEYTIALIRGEEE